MNAYEIVEKIYDEHNIYIPVDTTLYNGYNTFIIEGYNDDEKILEKYLEKYEDELPYDTVYLDSVVYCEWCNCYHWIDDVIVLDGEILCGHIGDEFEIEMIDDYINNYSKAIKDNFAGDLVRKKLLEYGFKEYYKKYQNGWYGREDKPEEIVKEFEEEYDYIFIIENSNNMFNLVFKIYLREKRRYKNDRKNRR